MELEIEASPGVISRIEDNETNPTKETLVKIFKALNLTKREYNYLSGVTSQAVGIEEISKAREEVREYLQKNSTIAYMVDDRLRLWDASLSFSKSIGYSLEKAERLLFGKSTIEIIVDPTLGFKDKIAEDSFEDVLYFLLVRFKVEVSFMFDCPVVKGIHEVIQRFPESRRLWEKAKTAEASDLYSSEARTVSFKYFGVPIAMSYSYNFLANSDRFGLVEYTPTSKLVRMLKGLG